MSRRSSPRRQREAGAVAVEAALVTTFILIPLVFGMIDFGMLFKDYLAVSSASRAGVRTASAEARVASFAQDAANQVLREAAALETAQIQEVWVYDANTNGYPDTRSDFASCTKCYKFRPTTGGTLAAYGGTTWSSTSQNACAGDTNRDSVGIYVKYEHEATIGLFFDDFELEDHVVMTLEPVTATQGCK